MPCVTCWRPASTPPAPSCSSSTVRPWSSAAGRMRCSGRRTGDGPGGRSRIQRLVGQARQCGGSGTRRCPPAGQQRSGGTAPRARLADRADRVRQGGIATSSRCATAPGRSWATSATGCAGRVDGEPPGWSATAPEPGRGRHGAGGGAVPRPRGPGRGAHGPRGAGRRGRRPPAVQPALPGRRGGRRRGRGSVLLRGCGSSRPELHRAG
ncbi:hypothetical protein HBB16_05200 [Pseudonocardia sp. MCCB 268]|nr:hypothetical protein [Pseudonocardia cytotoxica]